MHSFFDGSSFAAFAHRGGALEAAENTLEAFEHAATLGYRYIETDVQLTADGVVVIFHDDVLERLTGLAGKVSDHSWRELSVTRVHGAGTIPRLEDALAAFPEMRFNIDAKTDDVAAPLCQVARADNLDRLCLASDNDKRITFIRGEMGPGACTAAASWETAMFFLPSLAGLPPRVPEAHCFQIPPRSHGLPLVTPRQIAKARDAGKPIHIWTIDEIAEMDRLVDLGVQGLMTDRPKLLKGVLTRRNLWD